MAARGPRPAGARRVRRRPRCQHGRRAGGPHGAGWPGRRAGWDEPAFSLLHGDLSAGNILWDEGRPTLIDWEFARDGDPAEDLAYLTSEAGLTPDELADIAEGYVAAGGEAWAFARVPAWLPLVRLDAALWWADYWLDRGVDPLATDEVRARMGSEG